MPKRLKFVVEQWVLFMVRRQTWQAQRFEIFESARHFRIESNLEASQVPTKKVYCRLPAVRCISNNDFVFQHDGTLAHRDRSHHTVA